MIRNVVCALFCLLALPAQAEGTLLDRIVTFRVLAYDDPAAPLFDGRGETVRVSDAVEFGLAQEGQQNGFDVIPVEVNISASRVEVTYQGAPTDVWPSQFNGYVLSFDTECVLFDGAKVDPATTTIGLSDEDIRFERGELFLNLSGERYETGDSFAIDLSVLDCPLS